MDDDWYQLSLTLNAKLPFADAVLATSYFDRDFRYEADATAYEYSFNQNAIFSDRPPTISAAIRAASPPTTKRPGSRPWNSGWR